MGRASYAIYGHIDSDLILSGRLGQTEDYGPGAAPGYLFVDSPLLGEVEKMYFSYLDESLSTQSRNTATRLQYDYFSLRPYEVSLGADPHSDGPEDYNAFIALTFDFCAGMAVINADLAIHWAHLWAKNKFDEIKSWAKRRLSMNLDSTLDAPKKNLFLPTERWGYVLYDPEVNATPSPRILRQSPYFFFPGRLPISAEDKAADGVKIKKLDEDFGKLFSDHRCRCQLCQADFEPVQI